MKIYDEEMLEEINNGVDLLEYVGQQIDLRQKGRDFFGHCPLHVDNTPSFSITPDKNRYYCFSCKRGGGIISYLMEYEQLSLDTAVDKAARLSGINPGTFCQSETIKFLKNAKRKTIINPTQNKHVILPETEIDKYVKSAIPLWEREGISRETLELFDIRKDKNRIVYPVRDMNGNLINIKGRTVFENYKLLKIPKYINYFEVGVLDYLQCFDIAKEYIFAKKEIIVFESIKSVMKCWQWGYKNCVSAETHSLSPEQIKILILLGVDVVLAFDSDVNYWNKMIYRDICKLKQFCNLFIIEDYNRYLGGAETKNSPADCGQDIWEKLYFNKRKVA